MICMCIRIHTCYRLWQFESNRQTHRDSRRGDRLDRLSCKGYLSLDRRGLREEGEEGEGEEEEGERREKKENKDKKNKD